MSKLVIISFIMICVGVALLPHIIYIIVKPLSWIFRFTVRYRPYGLAALVLMGLWFILFLWGYLFGRYFYEVKQTEIPCQGLPKSFDGYRIVHISDLHLDGWEGHETKLQEITDSINAIDADLICFTGDLISLSQSELTPMIPILKTLKAKQGVVCIMGNHDYMPYNRSVSKLNNQKNVAEFQRMVREDLGWRMLLNEHEVIRNVKTNDSDSIAIIGCENQSLGVHPIIQRGNLTKAMEGTQGMFPIILTHDPTHWRGEICKKVNSSLTLSGHTHSGQFRVLGFSVARFAYKEYDGLYTEGNNHLYVNIGLGGTMPMRIGATPEITVITLKSL